MSSQRNRPYKLAIVGVGESALGKVPGKSSLQLQMDAVLAAVADAGLTKSDIDGIMAPTSLTLPYLEPSVALAEYLGLQPSVSMGLSLGGATPVAALAYAAAALEKGLCRYIVLASGEARLSGMGRDQTVAALARIGHPEFELPYGPLIPGFVALAAQRHMYEYGTTREHLARVAVTQRRHAQLHPNAHMRKPLTVEDVLASRPIATPLHLFDCAIISDGAAAVVLTTPERARDLAKKPVHVLGYGEFHTHTHAFCNPDLLTLGTEKAARAAYEMAGAGVDDIQVAQIYDSFTITLLMQLEALGICPKGESGPFVAEGHTALGGRIPVNTHGGLLSYAHPGTAAGLLSLIEGVRQVRGECGERQVPNVELCLVTGNAGAHASQSVVILGRS